MQKRVTSGNSLQFPEITAKFREFLTEKSAISVDFQQNFEKSSNITKSCEIKKIEIGAVQKYVNIVDLEKC